MQMGKWMTAMGAVLLFGLTGCARYEPAGAFEEPVALTESTYPLMWRGREPGWMKS